MADTQEGLNLKITGEQQASPAFQQALDLVAQLEAKLKAAGAAGVSSQTEIAASAGRAAAALDTEGAAGRGAGEKVAGGAAVGSSALKGLAGAAEGVKGALMTMAGPLTVLFSIGMALTASVKAAEENQTAMMAMGVVLKAAGINAGEAEQKIDAYATSLAKTSTVSKGEYVEGIRQMVAAHLSLGTALASQKAAQDISIVTGRSMESVERGLIMAHNGRYIALQRLGIITKEDIKNHISYNEVLTRVQERMSGAAAAAADTFGGRMKILWNNVQLLLEDIGNLLIPIIQGLIAVVQVAVQAVEPFVKAFGDAEKSVSDLGATAKQITAFMAPAAKAFEDTAARAKQDFAAISASMHDLYTAVKPVLDALGKVLLFLARTVLVEVAGVWKIEMDAIRTVVDAVVGLITGHWTKLHNDLLIIAGDGLSLLEKTFGGHLASILANIETTFQVAVQKLQALMQISAGVAAFASGDIGGGMAAMKGGAAALTGGPDFGKTVEQNRHNIQAKMNTIVATGERLAGSVSAPSARGAKAAHDPTADYGGPDAGASGAGGKSGKGKGGGGAGYTPTDLSAIVNYKGAVDALADSQSKLAQNIEHLKNTELQSKLAVELSTDSHGKAVAQMALSAKQQQDAIATDKLYRAAIIQDGEALATVEQHLKSHKAELERVREAYNHLAERLKGNKTISEEQKAELTKDKAKHADLLKTVQAEEAAQSKLTSTIDSHTKARAANRAAMHDADIAKAALTRQINDAKNAHAETLADEIATYGKSEEIQRAYYQKMIAGHQAMNEDDVNKRLAYQAKIDALDSSDYKKRVDAYDGFIATWKGREEGWINGILTHTKSLKDTLKSIFDTILGDFIKMIEQMIIKSKLLSGLNNVIAGFFSKMSGGGGIAGAVPGIAGAVTGAGPAAAATIQTAAGPAQVTHLASMDGGLKSLFSGGGGTTILPLLVAAGAAGLGAAASGLLGGQNKTGGAIGGLVGGVAGGALAVGMGFLPLGGGLGAGLLGMGPAGWALLAGGALLGGGLGGLIGGRPPDPQDYVTAEANLQGFSNANNAGAKEDPALAQLLGGTGISAIEKALANRPAWMSDQLYNELMPLFGSSASGSGQLQHGKNNTEWITGATGASGQAQSYTAFSQGLNDFVTALQGAATNVASAAKVFIVTRSYPDFNIAGGAGSAAAGGTVGLPPGLARGELLTPPEVHIHNPTIVGVGGVQELAQTISQAMAQNNNGTGVAPYRNSLAGRGAGDWSG